MVTSGSVDFPGADNEDFSPKLSDNFYCVPQGSRNHLCSYTCNVKINNQNRSLNMFSLRHSVHSDFMKLLLLHHQ